MQELSSKEIEAAFGGIGLNDLTFRNVRKITATIFLELGVFTGKVIISPWHAARGIVNGVVWGIKGCN